MAIDKGKLDEFLGGFVPGGGAVIRASTIFAGDKLGLYEALADNPSSPEELAKKTGTDSRCLGEWLAAQAASGYLQYDAASQRFWMTEAQAYALADQAGLAFIRGAFAIWRNTRLFPR
ncbi:MAG: hypothetical protein QOD67_1022 [Caballeronia sp.]|jgi:hypothetical protein|nr:hypothetical protein [Caballeronia sp.]